MTRNKFSISHVVASLIDANTADGNSGKSSGGSLIILILHILHIVHDHQGNLEGQGVIKFADIETGALLKLLRR